MSLEEQRDGSVVVLVLAGRLDSSTVGAVEAPISERAKAAPSLLLDLSGVPYVSSAGLRVLLKAAKISRAAGNRLGLSGLTPQVRQVFEISGFTPLFTIHEDRTGGVRALA